MSTGHFDRATCFEEIKADEALWRKGGTDLFGNPISNLSDLQGITYSLCVEQCGTAPAAFKVSIFTNHFGSFMLPYLALTTQLPFGSPNLWDNFSTIPLTIGSPTLAIFSLVITLLNSRWLKQRFARIHYPNTEHAVVVLNNLQQSLLRIEKTWKGYPLLASLVILPENDQWWSGAKKALSFTHTWTLANGGSIMWAVIAYIFTIVEVSATNEPPPSVIGPAVGCAWIWLLPLVVGWLFTSPNCKQEKLIRRLISLNQRVFVAVPRTSTPKLVHEELGHYPVMVWPPHMSKQDDGEQALFDAMTLLSLRRVDSVCTKGQTEIHQWDDEGKSSPFFNYARVFSWARNAEEVAMTFQCAARNSSARRPVTGTSNGWQVHQDISSDIHPDNRRGNAEDIQRYVQILRGSPSSSPWAPRVWHRVFIASAIAVACQWLCAGSAVLVAWRTPAIGLGCHSAAFLLYGILSMLSFLCIFAGETLLQYDHPTTPHKYPFLPSRIRYLASTLLRRLGKTIAWINALLFVSLAVMSFANLFYNCYCSSSVLGLGSKAYLVRPLMRNPMRYLDWWKACMAVATTSATLLGIFCWVMTA